MNMLLADIVLRQTTFHNGHGQMELSCMSLADAIQLCREIGDTHGGNPVFLQVWPEREGKLSGSIYEAGGIDGAKDKLWLSIEEIVQ